MQNANRKFLKPGEIHAAVNLQVCNCALHRREMRAKKSQFLTSYNRYSIRQKNAIRNFAGRLLRIGAVGRRRCGFSINARPTSSVALPLQPRHSSSVAANDASAPEIPRRHVRLGTWRQNRPHASLERRVISWPSHASPDSRRDAISPLSGVVPDAASVRFKTTILALRNRQESQSVMPLAMLSRSHAGYRRRHHWRHVDVEAAATAADEPDGVPRAPCSLTSSVQSCDVIMPLYGSAFSVVERPSDLQMTGKHVSDIFITCKQNFEIDRRYMMLISFSVRIDILYTAAVFHQSSVGVKTFTILKICIMWYYNFFSCQRSQKCYM